MTTRRTMPVKRMPVKMRMPKLRMTKRMMMRETLEETTDMDLRSSMNVTFGAARWRGRSIGMGLAALLLVSLAGCSEDEVDVDPLLPAVSAYEVFATELDDEIKSSGDLEARFHTMIAAEVAGRVTELPLDEGAAVEKGATVIEIDPARRKLDLGAARARLAQARANYRRERSQAERIRKLRSENIASEQQLEEAETALLLAYSALEAEKAAVGVAERALADASVSAPFAGMVARRSIQLGEFVQPGTDLFELVSMNPLEARFSVSEIDSQRVRPGQKVEIRVDAYADRVFEGEVTFVAPTVDPETRTLRVKAVVDNEDEALRPGLFARMSLGVSRREGVLMVPEEAVIQRGSGATIFRIVAEDRVERVEIETGVRRDGLVEIRGEIKPGDWIVSRGHGGLVDGMVIAIRESQPARMTPPSVMVSGGAQ